MKKYIAIFSVFVFALTLSGVSADNTIVANDADDIGITQVETIRKRLKIKSTKNAAINSTYNLNFVTGATMVAAADDIEAVALTNGDVTVNMSDTSDVNGTDVVFDGLESGDGDTNNLDFTDCGDCYTTQVEDINEKEKIELDSDLSENFGFNANVVTGADSVLAGGDLGDAGAEVTVDTGAINFTFDRLWNRQIDSITRNR